MHRRKVCHVLYSGLGGHGSVVFSCLESDLAGEFEHQVLFLGVEPILAEYAEQCRALGVEHGYVSKAPGSDMRTQRELFSQLRRWKPEVVLLHSGYAGLPGSWLYRALGPGVRLIYIEHTPNHQKRRVEWIGSALAGWLADRVVYLTQSSRAEVQRCIGIFFRGSRSSIIPNGIDTEYYKPAPLPPCDSPITIGMQARMTEGKDQASLILALDCLRQSAWFPRLKLQLAGDGPSLARLRELVEKHQLEDKVEFLGSLKQRQLRDFLWGLQIYVHSTKGETLSTAILQAQACQLPVIASKVKGVFSSISPGVEGVLVEAGNPVSLAQALVELLENPELARKLAAAARERVLRDFDRYLMWKSYAALCHHPRQESHGG